MDILITAGGTSEYIDAVRTISNSSTGRLSSEIFGAMVRKLDASRDGATIHYLHSKTAVLPKTDDVGENIEVNMYPISDTRELEATVRSICANVELDYIIHCMAVSDFYVADVKTPEQLSADMARSVVDYMRSHPGLVSEQNEDTAETGIETGKEINEVKCKDTDIEMERFGAYLQGLLTSVDESQKEKPKLSSRHDLMLSLKRTQKIIGLLRELNPDAVMVGFKLLNDVTRDELIRVAGNLGNTYGCEFVVANDMQDISGNRHKALIVRDMQVIETMENKREIAEEIAKRLLDGNGK